MFQTNFTNMGSLMVTGHWTNLKTEKGESSMMKFVTILADIVLCKISSPAPLPKSEGTIQIKTYNVWSATRIYNHNDCLFVGYNGNFTTLRARNERPRQH